MQERDLWQSPWGERYASVELLELFGPRSRAYHWRLMWYYLAKAQQQLGLHVTQEQVDELVTQVESIDFIAINAYEREFKHDVMAHVHAYGDKAPKAKAIIHLGATSADITDNADMIMYRKALKQIERDLVLVIKALHDFAQNHQQLVTLGFTHFQSATATTVGKRASGWLASLMQDLDELLHLIKILPMKGFKGATGSAESYRQLFNNDYERYVQMEQLIASYAEFDHVSPVAGQTYDRKWDVRILDVLNHLAISAHKISNDLRLLQHLKEFEEPFAASQIGSSAMAYKRNPMKAERVSALAKWVSSLHSGAVATASTQWLERTLDDSAIRRLNIPQAFFGVNAILRLLHVILSDAHVYERVISARLDQELPLLLTEQIMMQMVKAGGDRQVAHEVIRSATQRMAQALKLEGQQLSLIELLLADERCNLDKAALEAILKGSEVSGFAYEQTAAFLAQVQQRLQVYEAWLAQASLPSIDV